MPFQHAKESCWNGMRTWHTWHAQLACQSTSSPAVYQFPCSLPALSASTSPLSLYQFPSASTSSPQPLPALSASTSSPQPLPVPLQSTSSPAVYQPSQPLPVPLSLYQPSQPLPVPLSLYQFPCSLPVPLQSTSPLSLYQPSQPLPVPLQGDQVKQFRRRFLFAGAADEYPVGECGIPPHGPRHRKILLLDLFCVAQR